MSNPYQPPGGAPSQDQSFVLKEISSLATSSLIMSIIGIFCCGIILGPFAIYRGHKALNMIQQYNVGHEHSGKANAGKIIGIIDIVLFVIGIVVNIMLSMQQR